MELDHKCATADRSMGLTLLLQKLTYFVFVLLLLYRDGRESDVLFTLNRDFSPHRV